MRGSNADAYDTRALLRRGLGAGLKRPINKQLNRRCDDFCAQLLTLKKYSPARLAHQRRGAAHGGQPPPCQIVGWILLRSGCRIGDMAKWINDVAELLRRYYPLLQKPAYVFQLSRYSRPRFRQ